MNRKMFLSATVCLALLSPACRAKGDCLADWNRSCTLSPQDIFDFLNDWFLGDGDFNRDGVTTVQDIFDFLDAWFQGCPPPGVVRVAVFRVLRANSDAPGSPYNSGCRLSDEQINIIVADLQTNGSVFGSGVLFLTDNNPDGTVIVNDIYLSSSLLPPNGALNERTVQFGYMRSLIDDQASNGAFDPDAYNIYFVGNAQTATNANPPAAVLLAHNFDSRDAVDLEVFAQTTVNDFGFGSTFAFWNGYEPNYCATAHVLVHETGHYLGRLDQPIRAPSTGWPRSGTPLRAYDGGEHLIGSPFATNLMVPVLAPGQSYSLVVPGDCSDASTEKGQMFDKARTHTTP